MMLLATVMAFEAFCATAGYSLLATREAALGDEGGDPRAVSKEGAVALASSAGWMIW